MSQLSKFYRNKRVLITGHTGFIGSWLSKSLLMLGSQVCGYSLPPYTKPNLFETLRISDQIKNYNGDILDRTNLQYVISNFEPEIVFHLAAQPIVLEAYEKPFDTFHTNVIGTVNLLDILRKTSSVKVITVMTSDKAYRNNEWIYPYREIDPLGGIDPYSASKSCQDIVVNSFRESYFLNKGVSVASIRAGNIIGGGDWSQHRIMTDLVLGVIGNRPVMLRNAHSIRPWQHVLSPLFGMLMLTSRMWSDINFSGDWNFGPDCSKQHTVREFTEKFIEYWGSGSYQVLDKSNYRESSILNLDSSRSRNLLQWKPLTSFEDGLRESVEWYKTYYYNQKIIINLTESQISAFLNLEFES